MTTTDIRAEREISPNDADFVRGLFLPPTLTPSDAPTVYATAGIPGSGKSTYVDQCMAAGVWPTNAFILDPDRVMRALPSYQRDVETAGLVAAFTTWELPARTLTYQLAQAAMQRGVDIIQDMGAVRPEDYNRLASFKAHGYRLHMTYIYCPLAVALGRIKTRPRHTPPEMVIERNASLKALLPAYVTLADTFSVLDNSDINTPYRQTTLDDVLS